MFDKLSFFLSLMEVQFIIVVLFMATALDIGMRLFTRRKLRRYKNLISI